ncbi:MAG: hypothetical protein Q8T11_15245 [Elusimicrobiota bacterium]|nr:hypothetical protein [Elusimicrobiota bacterium]
MNRIGGDRLRLLAPAAVVILTFLVFSGSLANGFVNWDDPAALLDNAGWRGLGWDRLRWMLTAFDLGHYQPLSWLTLGIDHAVWGVSAFGIHLTSLLLHCGCALLVYRIALRLTGDRAASSAAALLFSLHPLRAESVAWAAQRRDPLSGLFFLWTMLCWLDGRRRWALVCALFSLSAKLTGLTLPAVLLLLDVYPLKRLPADWRGWLSPAARPVLLEKLPFAALSAVFLALNLAAQASVGALPALADVGWTARLGSALYSLAFYLGKTLWPAGLIPLYYGESASAHVSLALGGAAAAGLAAAGLRFPRLRPALAAAGVFYAVTLIPYLGLVKSGRQLVADRYTYISCLPWALLAGAGLTAAARGRPFRAAAAAALLAALGAAAWRQTGYWRDSTALWRHALSVEPYGDTARPFLAAALITDGRPGEAALYLEEQLAIFPGDDASRRMLQDLVGEDGLGAAERAAIHRGLAREFLERGESDKAAWHRRRAQALAPDPPPGG